MRRIKKNRQGNDLGRGEGNEDEASQVSLT